MEATLKIVERKLDRARKDLDDLLLELKAFDESNNVLIGPEVDADGRHRPHIFRILRQPSPDWEITMGEVAYQLRSALDHLVTQLVVWNGGDPDAHRGSFPIYTVAADYWKQPKRGRWRGVTARDRCLHGVAAEHKTAIDGLQPYQRGGRQLAERDPLAVLSQTCNGDKHRYGHPARFVLRSTAHAYEPAGRHGTMVVSFAHHGGHRGELLEARGEPIDDGADLDRLSAGRHLAHARSQGQVQMTAFRVGVAFGNARIFAAELEAIRTYIETRIIARFKPFFV